MAIDWDRRVIPIWRSSDLSSSLAESKSVNSRENIRTASFDNGKLEELLRTWSEDKTIGGAADLLNFAHIDNFKSYLVEPADFLINNSENLPLPLYTCANSILGFEDTAVIPGSIFENFTLFRKEAKVIKKRLNFNPRNSVALIDLARLYAAQGQKDKAKDSVLKALYLSKNHRFILRSAVRFLIHDGKPEEASYFLGKAESLTSDPWLLATHISLDTILERNPKYLKKSLAIIKSEAYSPMHITELASSIATYQAFNGDLKEARRNFKRSLIAPNENSIAQAIWASEKFSITNGVNENFLNKPFTHEARYYQYAQNADFELAIREAKEWFLDEPYAGRPLKAATYISCVIGDYKSAENLALQALKVDNDDLELMRNLIFALVAQDKVDEALPLFMEVVKREKLSSGVNEGQTLANWGMIQFRMKNYSEGEKYYKLAIDKFKKEGSIFSQAQAAAFMARESFISRNPDSERLLKETKGILEKSPSKVAKKILEFTFKSQLLEDIRSPVKTKLNWSYDSDKKTLMVTKIKD